MSVNAGLMSSETVEWATPQDFFDKLNRTFGFTLDPCATGTNAKCKNYFTVVENGLKQSWAGHRVFMNPPYGREIGQWVAKAAQEARGGALVVCLLPARVDTRWWHQHCKGADITFLRGRLKFGGSTNSAPFPSAIVIFLRLEAFNE